MGVCPTVFTPGCVTGLLWAEVSPESVWETSPGLSTWKDVSCPELPYLGPSHPLPMAQEQGSTCALSPCLSHVAHTPVPGPWLVEWTNCRPDSLLRVCLMLPVAVTSPASFRCCRTVPSQRGCPCGGHPWLLTHLPLSSPILAAPHTWHDGTPTLTRLFKWLYSSVRDPLVAQSKINLLDSISGWFYLKHAPLAWLWQTFLLFKPFQLGKKQSNK